MLSCLGARIGTFPKGARLLRTGDTVEEVGLVLAGSALIPEKATRDSAGVNVVTLKKNAKIARVTLADGLEQGVYPFGVCIRTDRSRVFQIFKKKLDAWIAEREE